MTNLDAPPSFSTARRWSISLNMFVSSLSLLALVLMINYLAARHFKRFSVSSQAQVMLSDVTSNVLASVTNNVKVIVYFSKPSPLFDSVWSLLKEYKLRNSKLALEWVDYVNDPGRASEVKAAYKLNKLTDKDLVIFDCKGWKIVPEAELSDIDIQPIVTQQGPARRTHFKGELLFTSALFSVTSGGPLRAFFLSGHGEHSPDDNKEEMGYGRFAELLKQNNIEWSTLSLLGSSDIPSGSLLVIAGGSDSLSDAELSKIEQYLKNGGRMLILFNIYTANKTTGLEKILADWGVDVGKNIVRDKENSTSGTDIVNSSFGNHPTTAPLFQTRLDMVEPRTIRKASGSANNSDAPNVTELVLTSPNARILSDIRGGSVYSHTTDPKTNTCLAVAVEKGKIKNVHADRGTTRVVAVGDSMLWNNHMLDSAGNRDFASLAVNWLMDQSELLAIQHQPITEYKLTMTRSQFVRVLWIMLGGMPGSVLGAGLLVWLRRRR